ncbi:hypothetical protein Q9Q99_13355 [Curtobacterium flaccumfaciens]|nr:hypothetical protein Q9Q99_13355 [Curtobacterium flaccumfaciens]
MVAHVGGHPGGRRGARRRGARGGGVLRLLRVEGESEPATRPVEADGERGARSAVCVGGFVLRPDEDVGDGAESSARDRQGGAFGLPGCGGLGGGVGGLRSVGVGRAR